MTTTLRTSFTMNDIIQGTNTLKLQPTTEPATITVTSTTTTPTVTTPTTPTTPTTTPTTATPTTTQPPTTNDTLTTEPVPTTISPTTPTTTLTPLVALTPTVTAPTTTPTTTLTPLVPLTLAVTTTTPTTPTQPTTNDTQTTQPTPKTSKMTETFPYTCPMCLEEFDSRRKLYRIVGCRHLYCQECVVTYYEQSVKDRKSLVKCPTPTCETSILFCNVKNLLSVDTLLVYQRVALKAPQNQQNAYIWCPGLNCKGKIVRQKTTKLEESLVRCPKCKLRVCFKCGEWEHTGTACDEADKLTDKKIASENEQREAFEEWKKTSGVVMKECPRCGAVIERTSGCSHMNCKACSYQFCFICLAHCTSTHCR